MPGPWLRNLLVRLALAALGFVGVTLLVFAMVHALPGDPVALMAGEKRLDPGFRAEMTQRLGLALPLHEQYLLGLARWARGDFGHSIVSQAPVMAEFVRLFPATLELTLAALTWAAAVGIPFGVWAAAQRGGRLDRALTAVSLFAVSVPIFWWGLLLIMLFAVELRSWAPAWALPVAGRIALEFEVPVVSGLMLVDTAIAGDGPAWRSAALHLLLPAFVLGTAPMAVLARLTRAAMLEVLAEDFIRTAKAKGLSRRRVIWVHALANARLPLLTVGGLLLGGLLGGAVFTETLFSWPGVGRWLVEAIARRDYPVLQGGILLAAALMTATSLLVDLLCLWADPRLRR